MQPSNTPTKSATATPAGNSSSRRPCKRSSRHTCRSRCCHQRERFQIHSTVTPIGTTRLRENLFPEIRKRAVGTHTKGAHALGLAAWPHVRSFNRGWPAGSSDARGPGPARKLLQKLFRAAAGCSCRMPPAAVSPRWPLKRRQPGGSLGQLRCFASPAGLRQQGKTPSCHLMLRLELVA